MGTVTAKQWPLRSKLILKIKLFNFFIENSLEICLGLRLTFGVLANQSKQFL